MKKILVTALITFALIFPQAALATETTNHIAHGPEKLLEKITLYLKFTPQSKAEYQKYLLEKRLAELQYSVTSNQIDFVEETASRYSTYLGNLTNQVVSHKLTTQKDDLLRLYQEHSTAITELQKNFKYGSGWWLAIQHDINTLKIHSDQLQSI